MKKFFCNLAIIASLLLGASATEAKPIENNVIVPGEVWNDTDGNPINAHGGGILYHNGKYYWYGEYKKGKTVLPDWATWECYRTDVTGVSCYSSPDMVNWTFEGIVLPAEEDASSDLHPSKVLERPKVIYNAKTGKFVMWAHVESADYSKAAAGVAVSDSPTGPFKYLGSFRPNNAMGRDQTKQPRSSCRFQARRKILHAFIGLHRMGPQSSRTCCCRLHNGTVESIRQSMYRNRRRQDILRTEHLCSARLRKKGLIRSHV